MKFPQQKRELAHVHSFYQLGFHLSVPTAQGAVVLQTFPEALDCHRHTDLDRADAYRCRSE